MTFPEADSLIPNRPRAVVLLERSRLAALSAEANTDAVACGCVAAREWRRRQAYGGGAPPLHMPGSDADAKMWLAEAEEQRAKTR
jgi:hypothetical protein